MCRGWSCLQTPRGLEPLAGGMWASPPPRPVWHSSPATTEHVLGPTGSEDQWKPSSQYLKIPREANSSGVSGAKPGS